MSAEINLGIKAIHTSCPYNVITETQYIRANHDAKASIIWLHGLGDKQNIESLLPLLGMHFNRHVNFIFPKAKKRSITVCGGQYLPGWFDIADLDLHKNQDNESIQTALLAIEKLIENEIAAGIPSKNIVLAGFSQGAALALYCALNSKYALAGVASLSGFFLKNTQNRLQTTKPSIFIGHGLQDYIVPVSHCEDILENLYNMGHLPTTQIGAFKHCLDEITFSRLGSWLSNLLKLSCNAPLKTNPSEDMLMV